MYRIDNPSAVVTMQAPGPPRAAGFFTDGNPAAGLEATIVDAWWMNQIQEEIISVINAANIQLNKASHTQLLDALRALGIGAGVGVEGAFLPLIGGRLYRQNNGLNNILSIDADAGSVAGLTVNVAGRVRWEIGQGTGGNFRIVNLNHAVTCLSIDETSHNVNIIGNDLSLAASGIEQYITRPNATQNLAICRSGGGNIARFSVLANTIVFEAGQTWTADLYNNNFFTNSIRARGTGGLSFVDNCLFSGNLSVQGTASLATVTANNITSNSIIAGQNINSNGTVFASGNISTTNDVSARSMYVSNTMHCNHFRQTVSGGDGWVRFWDHLQVNGYISSTGNINAANSIIAAGNVYGANFQGTGNIETQGNIVSWGGNMYCAGTAQLGPAVLAHAEGINTQNIWCSNNLRVDYVYGYSGGTTTFWHHASLRSGTCIWQSLWLVDTFGADQNGNTQVLNDLYVRGDWIHSDERLKRNITEHPISSALQAVRGIKFFDFDRADMGGRIVGHEDIGFTAQQVQSVMPDAVAEAQYPLEHKECSDGRCLTEYTPSLAINKTALLAYTMRAIQELADKVEALEKRGA